MLKGGGALNPDGLALDLALALDRSFTTDPADAGKALITSRRGPVAKFSRGSGATQVNAAGLIEYAPENLLIRSQDQSNLATWPLLNGATRNPNSSTGLDGTQSATTLIFSSNAFGLIFGNYNQPATINTPLTFSIWVSSTTNKKFRLALFGSSQFYSSDFTSTPTLTRYSFTVANPNNNSINACIVNESAGGAGEVVIWGAQLERASTARTYNPTTSAVFYGPRFDHDPATGASKGLLIEETRTNLLLRSESFEATSWIKGGPQPAVITADNIISPSGTLTADTLAMPAIALNQYSLAAQQFSGTAVPYTLTFYVKSATGGQTIWASLTPDGVNYFRQSIILTTEWQRVSLTATLTATQWSAQIGIDRRDLSQTGTGGFEFHVWGAQLEAGAFPLSYIPTTSGTAIRSADVCSITGTDFDRVYNQSELSIYSEVSFAPASAGFPVISFNNQTAAERVELAAFAGPTRLACFVVQNGTTQAAPNIAASANQFHKAALYAKLNSFQFALNGSLATKDTVGLMPTATRLNIGKQFDEVYLNGHLKQVTIYRKALTDAKLQTLTAP